MKQRRLHSGLWFFVFVMVASLLFLYAERGEGNGSLIPMVSVEWEDGVHSYINFSFTNNEGYYEMHVAEGTVNITSSKMLGIGNKIITLYNFSGEFYIDGVVWKNLTLGPLPIDDATIYGKVYNNETKEVIPNALISISFEGEHFKGENITFTDGNGYYIIHVPSSEIAITAWEYNFSTLTNNFTVQGMKNIDFYLDPIPPMPSETAKVRGYVKDESTGEPLETEVFIHGMNITYLNSTFTNGSGYYEFNVPAGNFSINTDAENYFPSHLNFEIYESETKWVNISLVHHPPDEAWVDGFVIDNETGLPIAGANVTVTGVVAIGVGSLMDVYERDAATDVNGYYNVSVPASYPFLGIPQYSTVDSVSGEAEGYFENSTSPSPFQSQILPGQTLRLNVTLDPMPSENCMVKGYVNVILLPSTKKIHYVGGNGEGNYTSIQDAIKNASDGDTIKVYPGVYDGPIIINKEVKLVGDPDIDGHGGYGIRIEANNTLVENFTIFNCSYGIYVHNDSFILHNVTIHNCTIHDATYGISAYGNYNVIIDCKINISLGGRGIEINGNGNEIVGNEISSNAAYIGIDIYRRNNTIENNLINGSFTYGIELYGSSTYDNIITSNNIYVTGNGAIISYAYSNTFLNNTINASQDGIQFQRESNNNLIEKNEIKSNLYGIYIGVHEGKYDNNSFLDNSIQANSGIYLQYATNSTFINNSIKATNYAIYIENSTNNTFMNNTVGITKLSFDYSGDLWIKNASLPASLSPHWHSIGKFLEIENMSDAWIFIKIYYDDSDVAGLYENTLKIWKWNGSWYEDGWNGSRYLDMTNNIVGVNITSFSIFAPLATAPNHLPYVTNPTPANGNTDISTNPTLSVVVYDEDNDIMNVSFYNASSNTLIGYVDGVLPGNTASIVWNELDYGTTYYWYVIVNDSYGENKSDVWHFATTPIVVYVDDDYNSGTPGWGYDHFASIQEGINAVVSGGTVKVYEGIYEESIGINKEVSIVAQGDPANTIIKASGQNAVMMNYPCMLDGFTIRDAHADYDNARGIWVKADGCIIRNVTITNISARQNDSITIYTYGIMINYADNCTIENVTIYDIEGNDSTAYGIYMHESDNDSSKNITIFNITSVSTAYGMYISYGENGKLVGINISNVNGSNSYGIRTGYADNNVLRWINVTKSKYGILLDYYSDYNIIENCIVANNTPYGIIIGKATHNVVRNNNVYDNRYGITLWTDCYNNTIENNTIFSNDYYGIYFYSEDALNTIKGNIIYDNQYGIYLNDLAGNNTILSNYIYNNGDDGMRIYSSYNNISFNHVYNNSKYGILIFSSESNTVHANYIHDNEWNGIMVSTYSYNNTIISNHVYNNSYDGIKLYYYTGYNLIEENYVYNNSNGIRVNYRTHKNNIIRGNHIYKNRFHGIFADGEVFNNIIASNEIYENDGKGILLNVVKNSYIENNTCYNNEQGIVLFNEADNNVMINNTVYGSTYYGILVQTSKNNTVAFNEAYNNSYAGIAIWYANNNSVYSNKVYDNVEEDILLHGAKNNTVYSNIIENCDIGITVEDSSSDNTIHSNNISSNNYGIYLSSSNNNLIYNNYFNNTINAWDNGNNIWNISKISGKNILGGAWLGGNYWHDYAGNDTDGDDLGDTMLPYNCSGNIANGGDWHPLLVPTNHPPAVPYNPTPSDGATDVELDITLQWQCYDPDGYALSYDMYFGPSPSFLEKKAGNITSASYAMNNLQYSTTYYWRVIAWDEYGAKAISPIWSFTTKAKPQYTLTVSVNPANAGIVSMNPAGGVYEEGTVVTLTATANEGYVFAYWSGDASGTNPTIQITMNSNKNVIANFQLPNTPPNIEILSPSDGSVVSGIITIQGIAWDDDGNETIERVEIRMDGSNWIVADGTTSWSYSWNTAEVANGEHVIEARCYDGQDYSNVVSVSITVNNIKNTPPVVSIEYPGEGSNVSGKIIIKGKAWDDDGNDTIVRVEIRIDGGEWKEAEGKLEWAYSLDTTKMENGEHVIEARCYDGIDYSSIVSMKINVKNEGKERELPVLTIAAVVIIAAITLIAVALRMRKR